MKFADLTQIALLGTERQPIPVTPSKHRGGDGSSPSCGPLTKGSGDESSPPLCSETTLDQLQSQVDVTRRERALLALAALSAMHERVGHLPPRDRAPLLEPCSPEQQSHANDRANSLLLRLLAGEFAELLPEWLMLASRAGQLALPETLPALLNTGNSKPDLREAILAVVGERGRWLARQNPNWTWVCGAAADDDNAWHTGERPVRLAFLAKLRKTDPTRIRQLLSETWNEETPEDRAAFVGALDAGLSRDDEEFLEGALDDKRKEVRRNAALLLSRLPGSKLAQRMTERVKPLLKFIPGAAGSVLKLKKTKPASIEVTLPAEFDKAMQRDGVEPRPQQGLGEKAWWLIQMLEVVPLDTWSSEWQATPSQIIAASQQGEWAKEFFEAWTRAVARQQNSTWAEALFDAALESTRYDKFEGLLGAMQPPQRERRLSALLAANDKNTRELHRTLLSQCRHDWSRDFSRAVLAFMRRESAEISTDWQLRSQFKTFAPRLAPEVLGEAATGWPTDSSGWEFWSVGIDDFLAVAQFRADLHAAFAQ